MDRMSASILGACLVVVALIVARAPRPPAPAPAAVPQVGRFQMFSVSTRHVYVIDTASGAVWESYVSDDSGRNDDRFSAAKVRVPEAAQ